MIRNVKIEEKRISWTTNFYKKIVVNAVNKIVSSAYVNDMLIFVEQDENDICTLSIYSDNGELLKTVTDNEENQIGSIGTEMNNTKIYIVIFKKNEEPNCYYFNKNKNSFEKAHPLY